MTHQQPYFRWPCGLFEPLGAPWQVFRLRPMPGTPEGDLVASFATMGAADDAAQALNQAGATLEEARARFAGAV